MQPRWGGVDGGQGGNIRGAAGVGNGGPAVQPALGVGDDVHLLTAGRFHDLPDAFRQLLPAALHRRRGLLLAVVDRGPVAPQLLGDAAPKYPHQSRKLFAAISARSTCSQRSWSRTVAVAVTQNSHSSSQPSASRWMRLVGPDFGIGRRFTQRNAAARGRTSHPALFCVYSRPCQRGCQAGRLGGSIRNRIELELG